MYNPSLLTQEQEKELVNIYQNHPESPRGIEALERLLERHKPLLLKLSSQVSKQHKHVGDLNDFMQYARLGMIHALRRYDPNAGTKVGSFIHLTVFKFLLDCADHDSAIRCPSQKRGMRSYLNGYYDDNQDKKKNFELQNNLTTDEAKSIAREKYLLLSPAYLSMENVIGISVDSTDLHLHDTLKEESTEEALISKIEYDMIARKLTLRQQRVLYCWFTEEMTMDEAADSIGISLGDVRNDIKVIRDTFKHSHSL